MRYISLDLLVSAVATLTAEVGVVYFSFFSGTTFHVRYFASIVSVHLMMLGVYSSYIALNKRLAGLQATVAEVVAQRSVARASVAIPAPLQDLVGGPLKCRWSHDDLGLVCRLCVRARAIFRLVRRGDYYDVDIY